MNPPLTEAETREFFKHLRGQRERLLKTIPNWFFLIVKDLSLNLRRLDEKYAALVADNETLKKRVEFLKKKSKDEDLKDAG